MGTQLGKDVINAKISERKKTESMNLKSNICDNCNGGKKMNIKETMKTIASGAFAYTKKIAKAGYNFVKEHPTETAYILLGGIVVGCAVGAAMSRKKYYIPDGLNEEKCEKLSETLDAIAKAEKEKKIWNEKYKETWDAVNEFAKHLKLQVGEMYIIEDQMQFQGDDYYSEVDFSMPVVSHMVFNEGIYPPGE